MRGFRRGIGLSLLGALALWPAGGQSRASHRGWPRIDGRLVVNGGDRDATLRGVLDRHNELLGGHGNDTIFAGRAGDVMWGDYKPSGQPSSQADRIHGGPGRDFIYSSHGFSQIWTGAGNDQVMLVYGHGIVYCNGRGRKVLVMRRLARNRHWILHGCSHARIVPYAA
ncbi:MAG TPA: hypothetical protein VGN69_00320 [Solirubrobacteraceae bacterium]|jgi:hypothetical protein|nr:hypothetical protein [Solirubrobacteraceae bacterium]